MNPPQRHVAVLGSTGSIGTNALEVIAASAGRLAAHSLTAHSRFELLTEQAERFRPRFVVATDEQRAAAFDWSGIPRGSELLFGAEGLQRVVTDSDVDVVLAGIVGSAGLESTWAALEAGKCVALANKETLVVAGSLAMQLAGRTGATILPVDSEHSGVFQVLDNHRRDDIQRIVLTASGGPFRERTAAELEQVTVAEALNHPTWDMGPKITVDSATMMNKALEIIEARWLFHLSPDQIGVTLHPQSIVHALVEFVDGSVIAQLSPPDMKLPIQFALEYPFRHRGVAQHVDWTQAWRLDLQPPDFERFPALSLGMEAARSGGTTGAVLNAANEAAVTRFLQHDLRFSDIVPACKTVLESHHFESRPTLEQLRRLDGWAREEVARWAR